MKAIYDPEQDDLSPVADVWGIAHALPPRVDDIFHMLQIMGIKGRIGDPLACPLANYFRLFSQGQKVAVDSNSFVEVGDHWFEPPAVVDAFAGMFDEGCFPELIERLAIEARQHHI